MSEFKLITNLQPAGDQPKAIEELTELIRSGRKYQTLLGVTGSGKTFTMANIIQNIQRPVLVISHNKTLAAQLYGEFKSFFPHNAVEYFISYYDYYQPEAYIPVTDTYISKEATINDLIDKLRLRATASILERRDVIVVASVSCIYGLGSPLDYRELLVPVQVGMELPRDELLLKLVDIHYTRNDIDFGRGKIRVRGDIVEIYPAYEDKVIRLQYWGDIVEELEFVHPVSGEILEHRERVTIYPARHFVTTRTRMKEAVRSIRAELEDRVKEFEMAGKVVEAQRIKTRTEFDIELMLEFGYCPGIENYSRHISGRRPGERPSVLVDYFPEDFLVIIDESHVTIPQLQGMYMGDRSRKLSLIEYGFRLPSALDNRPLFFEEFESLVKQVLFVSATPGDYEIEKSSAAIVEQIVRPTGLIDPEMIVRPSSNQVEDLIKEIKTRIARKERVLVTTLTKRMAEDLSAYLTEIGIRSRYLHSDLEAIERMELLRGLRLGEFDVLVGINLLREGLDLPEVSLVAILDADKVGFLRSARSIIQTAGRASRNACGTVILYADQLTDAMKEALAECERRRNIQLEYNRTHNIIPKTIYKTREEILATTQIAQLESASKQSDETIPDLSSLPVDEQIEILYQMMKEASDNLEFEFAIKIRDKIRELKKYFNPKMLTHKKKSRYAKFKRRGI